ncbi:uncharacterized protein KIAA1522 [Carassius auratus]|uniref:Uncharacterized protein KIAA1522-like n=1 Tax=Carassius auratus TaxID=7957 RepID=A0A6P6L7F0_CARAU|nr:uncharacterized protein KIAA1522-like [Carassius auratus]XP_026079404.1 uncharacterized protein KIAA1522-like [Carassius auratus]XP_026079405.1 uncharacterized protein KIAA1522-like [Carassius auratus]XP_026079406.1 uncharacterized protein KIAA1522-like [Carassius auratus]
MSSGRESVGDLIPPDMLQVFSEDRQGGRGKRGRRRAASFRRAFKWLKRQRRKTRRHATEKHGDLLATGSPVELPKSSLVTGPKEEVMGAISLQEFQENVFVEGNRPKYVLDLHTEAQQGLKMQQQEDDSNGTDYPDDQSMISTVTAQTEDSMAFSELRGFESESTAADSVSMRSSISSRSTRSGLKRQASTFTPLKPDKTAEKKKSRRKHGRPVVGIPRHVQKEMGLDRAAWITTNPLDGQLFNGDMILPAMISPVDSTSSSSEQESVHDHLQGIQNLYTVKRYNTELPTLTKPRDDILQGLINHSLDPEKSGAGLLGVPWTENSAGAVMSMSPQATYMSKIIPNAVLPPSVDVVELSRNRSRSSVRTVSKSSLVSASPASTRASSRVSSRCSTSRSNYSGWTNSGSSETLVSDSSTISSSSTPRVASRGSQVENTNRPVKLNNDGSHVKTTHVNGGSTEVEDSGKTRSAVAFTRNLSVIKRGKKPPAPPSRSYSLHNRNQTWKTSESPSYLADDSTPDGSPYPAVMSPKISMPPSDGPTTAPSDVSQPVSTDKKMKRMSSIAELKISLLSAKSLINGNNSSPVVVALLSLLEIPNHPKVLAPPAPPPETWAHNQRTFELLCGPGPVNYTRWAKKRGLKIADEPVVASANADRVAPLLQSVEIKGKVETAAPLASVAPSPSPPPDHCPPTPNNGLAKPPDFVPPTPTLAAKAIKDLTSWIPPPPLFPPPAPPAGMTTTTPVALQNDTDLPPPPPPFSPQSLLTMTQLPPDIPPPPLLEVPPPPRPPSEAQKISSPPQESQPSTHNVLVTSSETSEQITFAPPPPLPTDVRSQVTVPPPPPLPTDVRSQQVIVPPPPPTVVRSQVTVPPPPPLPTDVRSQQISVPPPPPTDVRSQQVSVPPPPPTDVRSQQVSVPPLPPPSTDVRSQVTVPPPPPLPTDLRSQQVSVPPPAPLPSNVKMEGRREMTEMEKRTSSPSPAKEETSSPVVTQSLLQMVRLRSVKSSQSPAVGPDKSSQTKPKSGVNQEAPPKPMRRSLILTSLPPDVEALSSEPKTEALSLNTNTTTVSNTQQRSSEPETQSNNIAQKTENTILEPKYSSATCPPTEPNNNSVPAEPATKQPCAKTEPKPQTLKEQIQPTVPDPETLPSSTEPKDQSISEPKTQHQEQEPNKIQENSEKQLSTIEIHSKPDGEQPKTQTPIPIVSSTPPIVSTAVNPSMRLQEAIRLKAAAMSSKDNQAKRFGLRSPPPATTNGTTVPNSSASMASFIFSKSPKKVVIETPSSLEVQTDLKKTLVAELASVSDSAKSNDLHKMANKVPPPIAKKPNAKAESVAQNSAEAVPVAKIDHVQTETVQTAGQDVQTENSEKTNE